MTDAFHRKYRPSNLGRIIGHDAVVTRLQGMVKTGKVPNAIAFFGSSGAGKTTLARAFAADLNGLKRIAEGRDYAEYNASEAKTLDDVRAWISTSRFKPQHKKRVICIDEAQGLLSNPQAANAFLKPLEEPAKDTLWIIASMSPEKFQSTETGRAILKRCSQFILEPHTPSDMLKQAKRIAKGEDMSYAMGDEDKLLKAVVKSVQDMRSLANVMQSLQQYYDGLEKKPKKLDKEHIAAVLETTESADDKLAATVIKAIYQGQFKVLQRALLDVQDGFMFVSKLLWLNAAIMNNMVLEGARHRKVWITPVARDLIKETKGVTLGALAATNATLVETKGLSQQFATSPEELLSAKLYRLIKEIHSGGKG